MKKNIKRLMILFSTLGVILLNTETTKAANHVNGEAHPGGTETFIIGLDDTFADEINSAFKEIREDDS